MTATSTTATKPAPRPLLPAAEVTLTLVTLATVAGLWRLFEDGSYFPPLFVDVVAAHLLAAGARRRGLSLAVSGAVQVVAGALALTWSHLWSTTTLGLPTPSTLSGAGDRLAEAWTAFGELRAPAPVLPGFLIAIGAAVWLAAWLADVAAFRLWTPFEALIPAGTLFLFASLFSADQSRSLAAALWMASVLLFFLMHRTARQQGSPVWLGSDPRRGTAWLLQAGAAVVAVAVLAGAIVGPAVPTADAEPVYDLAARGGDGSRTTVSPLVEINRRLLQQPEVELFTVRSTQRSYWRLTSLDIFDGTVWSSRGSFEGADGQLPGLADALPGTTEAEQEYSITQLAAIWLPAAFEARAVEPGEAEVRWEAVTSTLIVSTDFETSDGVTYGVTSALPTFAPEQLTGTDAPPEEVVARGLGLPLDFPEAVVTEAQRVVAGAATPFDQALALQSYFRDGSFTYDLSVPPSHSSSAIEQFLFETRAGYCEQFAGTFAAMARAVGLPARVAVGFTPGIEDPGEPGLYHVRGEHAHAWPEVWIAGAGWVPFEPTPGRGSSVMAAYTGVPDQQDTPGASQLPDIPFEPTPGSAVPADPAAPGEDGATTTTPPTTDPEALPPGGSVEGDPPDHGVPGWLPAALLALSAAVATVALAAASVAGWRVLARARRRAAARTDDDRVRAAWAEAVEAVGVVGIAARRHETAAELAVRMGRAVEHRSPAGLAALVTRADFSPTGAAAGDAEQAVGLLAEIRGAVKARTTQWDRILAAVDPRPPARRTRERPSGPRLQIGTT